MCVPPQASFIKCWTHYIGTSLSHFTTGYSYSFHHNYFFQDLVWVQQPIWARSWPKSFEPLGRGQSKSLLQSRWGAWVWWGSSPRGEEGELWEWLLYHHVEGTNHLHLRQCLPMNSKKVKALRVVTVQPQEGTSLSTSLSKKVKDLGLVTEQPHWRGRTTPTMLFCEHLTQSNQRLAKIEEKTRHLVAMKLESPDSTTSDRLSCLSENLKDWGENILLKVKA